MRVVFFLLLIANLAFFGWAELVDAPQPAPTNEAYAKLPRLKLVNELPTDVARPSSGNARKTALEVEVTPEAPRCLSIGPFDDQDSAMRSASKLREKGLTPRQRVEKGEISKGFWVYIGGLKTDDDVAKVLRMLEQSHVDDAHLMPDTAAVDAHQVSVGLFSERDRADHRAESVQKLGLRPEVAERKLPATLFWMDVDLAAGAVAPTPQEVAAGADTSHIEVTPCPVQASPEAAPVPASPDATPPFRTKVAGASKLP